MKSHIALYRPSLRRKDFRSVVEYLFEGQLASGEKSKALVSAFTSLYKMSGGRALRSHRLAIVHALRQLSIERGARVGMSALAPAWYYHEVITAGYVPVLLDTQPMIPLLAYKEDACDAIIIDTPFGYIPDLSSIQVPIILDISTVLHRRERVLSTKNIHSLVISLEDDEPLSVGGGGVFLHSKKLSDQYCRQELLPDLLSLLALTQLSQIEYFNEECRKVSEEWREALAGHGYSLPSTDHCSCRFLIRCEKSWNEIIKYANTSNIALIPAFGEIAAQRKWEDASELKVHSPHAYQHLSTLLRIPLYPHLKESERKRIRAFLATLP